MEANLELRAHRAPRSTASIAALWVGFGVALGGLGTQLWSGSRPASVGTVHASTSITAAPITAAPITAAPARRGAAQAQPRPTAAGDPADLETTERSIANYDR